MPLTTSPAPAVVLVHGAFADASGFRGVIRELQTAGHSVTAPPNPLRSLAFDATGIAAYVAAIDGPQGNQVSVTSSPAACRTSPTCRSTATMWGARRLKSSKDSTSPA